MRIDDSACDGRGTKNDCQTEKRARKICQHALLSDENFVKP